MPCGAKQVFDNVRTERERESGKERERETLGGTSSTLVLLFELTLKPCVTAAMFRQALCVLSAYVKKKKKKLRKKRDALKLSFS